MKISDDMVDLAINLYVRQMGECDSEEPVRDLIANRRKAMRSAFSTLKLDGFSGGDAVDRENKSLRDRLNAPVSSDEVWNASVAYCGEKVWKNMPQNVINIMLRDCRRAIETHRSELRKDLVKGNDE